mgnify:CR=1 FL=1|jgi:hypothetical protein
MQSEERATKPICVFAAVPSRSPASGWSSELGAVAVERTVEPVRAARPMAVGVAPRGIGGQRVDSAQTSSAPPREGCSPGRGRCHLALVPGLCRRLSQEHEHGFRTRFGPVTRASAGIGPDRRSYCGRRSAGPAGKCGPFVALAVRQGRYRYGEAQVNHRRQIGSRRRKSAEMSRSNWRTPKRTGGLAGVMNLGVVRGNLDRVQSEVRQDFVAQRS